MDRDLIAHADRIPHETADNTRTNVGNQLRVLAATTARPVRGGLAIAVDIGADQVVSLDPTALPTVDQTPFPEEAAAQPVTLGERQRTFADPINFIPRAKRPSVFTGRDGGVNVGQNLTDWSGWLRRNRLCGDLKPGYYKLERPWELTPTDGSFTGITIRGAGSGHVSTPGKAVGAEGETIIDHSALTNLPGIAINNSRGLTIEGLHIVGPNTAPEANFGAGGVTNNDASWVGGGAFDNRYSPSAGIYFDPWSNVAPPDPADRYPVTYFGTPSGSQGCTLRNIMLRRQVVGIAMGTGYNAVQCDYMKLYDVRFRNSRVGLAIGTSQADDVAMFGCEFDTVQWALHTAYYGNRQGAPPFAYGTQVNNAFGVFAYVDGFKSGLFDGLMTESIVTLGMWGLGVSTIKYTLTLLNTMFHTRSDYKMAPFVLENHGPAIWDGGDIKDNLGFQDVFAFGGGGALELRNLAVAVTSVRKYPFSMPRDFAKPFAASNIRAFSGSATYDHGDERPRSFALPNRVVGSHSLRTVADASGRYSYVAGGGNSYRTLPGSTASAFVWTDTTLQYDVTPDAAAVDLLVGDQLYLRFVAVPPSLGAAIDGIGGRVTAILRGTNGGVTATVQIALRCDGSFYDQATPYTFTAVRAQEHTPGVLVTATLTAGSAVVPVSSSAPFDAGDYVASLVDAGIHPSARIKSVDSATQVTLTRAPTGSGTFPLFYGKLLRANGAPLFAGQAETLTL